MVEINLENDEVRYALVGRCGAAAIYFGVTLGSVHSGAIEERRVTFKWAVCNSDGPHFENGIVSMPLRRDQQFNPSFPCHFLHAAVNFDRFSIRLITIDSWQCRNLLDSALIT